MLHTGILASARQWLSKKLGWESADSRSFRQKVKDDHTAQTNLLNEAGRRKADLQAKLQLDAGPNNEFLALVDKCVPALFLPKHCMLWLSFKQTRFYSNVNGEVRNAREHREHCDSVIEHAGGCVMPAFSCKSLVAGRCFTANVEKYVYEVCLFKNAAQKDGGLSTSLGSWQGFAEGYSALLFTHGQHCWNGPQRSLRVRLPGLYSSELKLIESKPLPNFSCCI